MFIEPRLAASVVATGPLQAATGDSASRYGSTMLQAFLFAVVITSPYGVRQFRRWRARRAADRVVEVAPAAPIVDTAGIERLVASMDELADAASGPTALTLTLADRPTYRGRPVDRGAARLIVTDAARVTGLSVRWLDDHRVIIERSDSIAPGR